MTTIIDSGALVALIRSRDQYHKWAHKQTDKLDLPYITCESVLSESWFLLREHPNEQERLLDLINEGDVVIEFNLSSEIFKVIDLMVRYNNVPMSVADACLVRMSALYQDSVIFSTDSDFHIYRRHGNKTIPSILPPSK